MRAANAAAVLAFLAVSLGGLTAKLPSAAIACRSFPLCGADPAAGASAVHVQLTHRLLAFLLLLHLIGVVRGFWRRRDESRTVARAATIAFGLVVLQFIVAASMVLLTLPAMLRSSPDLTTRVPTDAARGALGKAALRVPSASSRGRHSGRR